MSQAHNPSLFQINTRICLRELGERLGKPATLADVPDADLDRIAASGFEWVWPLGVWQTGPAGRQVSRTQPEWRREYQAFLPDLTDDDITGSPFAIQEYRVNRDFGGPEALANLRDRLKKRGLKMLLDFVPNHSALDHPWVSEHPEYYIGGDDNDLAREPHNYVKVETRLGPRVLAHGRDPYFPGWPDTLQLNYRSAALRRAMTEQLLKVAGQCDGVRCDMAMLLLPDVIMRTWGEKSRPSDDSPPVDAPFWPEAIAQIRGRHASFIFMAEVYWDLEWTLQQQGFDYTYDKRLYDRLHECNVEGVRGHLHADTDFQRKSVRFMENHDEPRAAAAFPRDRHLAAATVTYLLPGLRFFHEGQLEGRQKRVPMHLGRRPAEKVDTAIQDFYEKLLAVLKNPVVRGGDWKLLDCRQAWANNPTHGGFLACSWEAPEGRLLVAVNYGATQGQCRVQLPWPGLVGKTMVFADRLSFASYEREGSEIAERGLFLDMPAYGHQVFDVKGK
ncbi:MAG: alpha-amylase [Planctomycetes bacterium]|nr:alpha-amylase [Planctomycetota bacterium]